MKKLILFFTLSLVLVVPSISEEAPVHPVINILAGTYVVVGRFPDTGEPYTGTLKSTLSHKGLKLVRTVNNKTIRGTGRVDTATQDKIPILRTEFTDGGKKYEETCMLGGDLNNLPRVTCYLYYEATKKVGLEAWFPDHGQLEQK